MTNTSIINSVLAEIEGRELCSICDGEGWTWAHENPYISFDPFDCYSDDTKYICYNCNGSGIEKGEVTNDC